MSVDHISKQKKMKRDHTENSQSLREKCNTPKTAIKRLHNENSPRNLNTDTTSRIPKEKLKSPKSTFKSLNNEKFPKKFKSNIKKGKFKHGKRRASNIKEDIPPMTNNVIITLKSFHRTQNSDKSKRCLTQPVMNIFKAMEEGKLTEFGTICFEFNDEEKALSALNIIEGSKFESASFSVDMSKNSYEPKQRSINIGKDVNVCIFEEAMKKEFNAVSVEPLINRKGSFTGLSILTFSTEADAKAADLIQFDYAGQVRTTRPYVKYNSTRPKLRALREQEKSQITKSILAKTEKVKKVEKPKKRKIDVLEEEIDSEEVDDQDQDEDEYMRFDASDSDDDDQ